MSRGTLGNSRQDTRTVPLSFQSVKLEKSYARNKTREYKSENETHHIVAQTAKRAQAAREIKTSHGIMIDDTVNLIELKTGLHRRLHTNLYYELVNIILKNAETKGNGNYELEKINILAALNRMSGQLELINQLCPY